MGAFVSTFLGHSTHPSTPDKRFDHIHVDIVGPLSPSHGQTYLLTCIDRFTRWPEAFPLSDVTAPSVAHALISGWISRFGVPSTITTDRGGQFESDLWAQIMTIMGTTRICTTSYRPQANGLVERFHRQLKGALRAQLGTHSWTESLPLVLLGIRTALKEDLHCTVAELVYGMSLRLPGEIFSSSSLPSIPDSDYVTRLKQYMSTLRATPACNPLSRNSFIDDSLSSTSHIFIRRDAVKKPLQQPYDGPFRVLSRTDKYFVVDINGKQVRCKTWYNKNKTSKQIKSRWYSKLKYLQNSQKAKERSAVNYSQNAEHIKQRAREYSALNYRQNPEPIKERAREHSAMT